MYAPQKTKLLQQIARSSKLGESSKWQPMYLAHTFQMKI